MEAFLKKDYDTIKKETNVVPWVEKYRPKCIDDISSQEEIVSLLKKSISNSDFPNLLFYGPPGTGKTSTIIAAAKDLFGSEAFKDRVLELNASDERGIKVIREKVKTFAQTLAPSYKLKSGKICPSFKIIILDEADSMTSFAQAALRRIMETESKMTRFCIICNYISRIIEPISSRCAKFRFKPLPIEALTKKLTQICENEHINIDPEVLEFLVDVSEGDMRKSITYLQSAYRVVLNDEPITKDNICDISGIIPKYWVDKVMSFYKTQNCSKLVEFVEEFISTGLSVTQLIYQLTTTLIDQTPINESDNITEIKSNCNILKKCGEIEFKLLDGADEELELLDLIAYAISTYQIKY